MRKKWVILLVVLLGFAALSFFLLSKQRLKKESQLAQLCIKGSYFEPVKILEFSSQIPCVDIRIGGKSAKVKVDLGFCGDISLPKEIIQEIDQKSFAGKASYFGIRGKKYDSNLYEFPEVKLGEMVLFRARVKEIDPEFERDATIIKDQEPFFNDPLGRLGWALFHNFNFFMDTENALIAFCDSLKTLEEQGYPVDLFVETPLLLDRNAIEFEAISEVGPMRCLLDTGSTWNMFNKERSNEQIIHHSTNTLKDPILPAENSNRLIFDPEDIRDLAVFKIGEKEFGPVKFNQIKTPLKIDAIMGMEFLSSKLVFIDFPNRKIYFYEK